MGLRDYLKKRRTKANSEKQIKKKAKRLYSSKKGRGPTPIERTVKNVSDRGIQLAWRAYHGTQNRKGEGKEIIMNRVKKIFTGDSSISSMTRTLLRDPNRPRTKSRVPSSKKVKTTRRQRRRR